MRTTNEERREEKRAIIARLTAAGLVSALNKSARACRRYNDYYYLKK